MQSNYKCCCKYCGKTFYSRTQFKSVCGNKECQFKRKKQLGLVKPIRAQSKSINEVCKTADWWSKRLKKNVTYGQASLYVDLGIRIF